MIDDRMHQLRREYESEGLVESNMAPDPFSQFESWFRGVVDSGLSEPNAFILATATRAGIPSCRAVLMKDMGPGGLVFYTNLESRKSVEITQNPNAAAVFAWVPLHRQVRIEGIVEPVTEATADEYFATRPRGAQLAAHASPQSAPVESREQLELRFAELDELYPRVVPRPSWWGGWRLVPSRFEFWQGQPNRFHDRVCYVVRDGVWEMGRLAP